MITAYRDTILQLIERLEYLSTQDLGDQYVRQNCASILYGAHYTITDPQEQALSARLVNAANHLEAQTVLAIDHPLYDQDRQDFKNSLDKIITSLKEI